jgi:hypothetical protein
MFSDIFNKLFFAAGRQVSHHAVGRQKVQKRHKKSRGTESMHAIIAGSALRTRLIAASIGVPIDTVKRSMHVTGKIKC